MKTTPAQRVRARRDKAFLAPPPAIRPRADIPRLVLEVAGRRFPIGANVDGSTPWEMAGDAAATIQLPVRSPDGSLLEVLSDEALLQEAGVRCMIDGVVYVVDAVDIDDGLYSIGLIDEVAWRLQQFTSFRSATRGQMTLPGFIRSFVDEASRPPLAPMAAFIPELRDRQPIRGLQRGIGSAKRQADEHLPTRGQPGRARGLGEGVRITIEGRPATAEQRRVIDEALTEAQRLGAAPRVMVACVMTMSNESRCQELGYGDAAGPDSRGPYQQRGPWGPLEQRMDAAGSTRLFLTANKGHGVEGWAVLHGGLKHAPGDLGAAIYEVQIGGSPETFNRWEPEATRTVEAWLGAGGFGTSTIVEPFEYTRGERKGERESSWDASGRYAELVNFWRWAAGNVFHYVSTEELRAAAPSVAIDGSEAWLLGDPQFSWGSRRTVTEVTIRVLAERWGVMPGGVAVLETGGATDGRFLVRRVAGASLEDPEAEVTLVRPTRRRPEPANETRTVTSTGSGSAGGGTATGNWIWPTDVRTLASDFGPRVAPTAGASTYHDGIDIAAPGGAPVRAVDGGRVTRAFYNGGYGNYVEIDHGGGLISFYAHLSSIRTTAGAQVSQGDVVGLVGTTGTSTGNHLHFGTHLNGARVNPLNYLP